MYDDDDFFSDRWTGRSGARTEPLLRRRPTRAPRRTLQGGRDPFRARLGAALLGFVLLIPVAISLRDGRQVITAAEAPGAVALIEPGRRTASPATVTSDAPATAPTSAAAEAPPVGAPAGAAFSAEPAPVATTPAADPTPAAAEVAVPAERVCPQRFTVRPGDYWIGLADAAGVTLRELLAANGATTSSPLYPGDEICLPAGARTPPSTTTTTAAPPTTSAPTRTTPSTAPPPAPSTTRAPAPTTAAPPTTSAPARTYTRDQIIQIIRDVWPDDQEERAILVVQRESNFRPTAKNSCCYGLFQIYYQVHRSWLAGMGVTSAEQLYDPLTNVRAAYTLYQRSGGWGPWSQTAYSAG